MPLSRRKEHPKIEEVFRGTQEPNHAFSRQGCHALRWGDALRHKTDPSTIGLTLLVVPLVALGVCAVVVPCWVDQVLMVTVPGVPLFFWVSDQLPHFMNALGDSGFFLLLGLGLSPNLGYAFAVASALRRHRLRIVLVLISVFHLCAVGTAVGTWLSWGFDTTPLEGSGHVIL